MVGVSLNDYKAILKRYFATLATILILFASISISYHTHQLPHETGTRAEECQVCLLGHTFSSTLDSFSSITVPILVQATTEVSSFYLCLVIFHYHARNNLSRAPPL